LEEVVADALGQNTGTKRVSQLYNHLIENGQNEFNILLNLSKSELDKFSPGEVGEGILRVREGKIHVEPGYDGVFGKVRVFSEEDRKNIAGAQASLF